MSKRAKYVGSCWQKEDTKTTRALNSIKENLWNVNQQPGSQARNLFLLIRWCHQTDLWCQWDPYQNFNFPSFPVSPQKWTKWSRNPASDLKTVKTILENSNSLISKGLQSYDIKDFGVLCKTDMMLNETEESPAMNPHISSDHITKGTKKTQWSHVLTQAKEWI